MHYLVCVCTMVHLYFAKLFENAGQEQFVLNDFTSEAVFFGINV